MTKKWSSTRSGDGKTKRQASKEARQKPDQDLETARTLMRECGDERDF